MKNRHPSGNPALRDLSRQDRTLLRGFRAWLNQSGDRIAAPSVEDEITFFAGLLRLLPQVRLSLADPSGVEEFVGILLDMDTSDDSDSSRTTAFLVLDDYIHFRIDDGDPDEWAAAHAAVQDALTPADPIPGIVLDVIADGAQLDEHTRRTALATTRVVAKVRDLLVWIGDGRPVTATGSVRRADIAPISHMLGIAAIGVDRKPARHTDPDTAESGAIHALSMNDVPLLGAWWQALLVAELIRLEGTRVRPGPAADAWLVVDPPPLEASETVVSVVIAEVLMDEYRHLGVIGQAIAGTAIALLVEGVSPDHRPSMPADGLDFADLFGERAFWTLRQLAGLGLLEVDSEGSVSIPLELRATVARGILATTRMMAAQIAVGRSTSPAGP